MKNIYMLIIVIILCGCSNTNFQNQSCDMNSLTQYSNLPLYKNFFYKQSEKVHAHLESLPSIQFVYFNNIDGIRDTNKSVVLAERSFYSAAYSIDLECSNTSNKYLQHDATVNSTLEVSKGILKLTSLIKTKNNSHIIETEFKHNYAILKI